MDTKQQMVNYLLSAKHHLERQRGRPMTHAEFADYLNLPPITLSALLDPDKDRLPQETNAEKIAVALGSNKIMHILGYKEVDAGYIRLMKVWRQLDREQQTTLLGYMENFEGVEGIRVVAT